MSPPPLGYWASIGRAFAQLWAAYLCCVLGTVFAWWLWGEGGFWEEQGMTLAGLVMGLWAALEVLARRERRIAAAAATLRGIANEVRDMAAAGNR